MFFFLFLFFHRFTEPILPLVTYSVTNSTYNKLRTKFYTLLLRKLLDSFKYFNCYILFLVLSVTGSSSPLKSSRKPPLGGTPKKKIPVFS